MVLYTVLPPETVLEGFEEHAPRYEEVADGGRILLVEPGEGGRARLARLISTNPYDYLDPALQPGRVVVPGG